jgi:multiple sugar transport system permease protein
MAQVMVRRPARRLSREHREWLAAALFLLPDAAGLLVFVAVPIALVLAMGFFDVTEFGSVTFVGLGNYRAVLQDPVFLKSLEVTVTYVALFVPSLFVVSLCLAVLVQQKVPFVGVWRTLFFVPNAVSLVVVALVWQFLLGQGTGVVDQLLAPLGLRDASWLGDPRLALPVLVGISVWIFMGYYMVIFLAALEDVPKEFHDAARIDGAGAWARFRHISWPLIRPTSFFVLLLTSIGGLAGLQGFDLVYVATQGGPANATQMGIFYVYQQAFLYGHFGYAAAMASVIVVVLLIWSAAIFVITKGGRFDTGQQ